MPRSLTFFLTRSALLALSGSVIIHRARADVSSVPNDAYVERSYNHGDAMTPSFSDSNWNYRWTDSELSKFFSSVRVRLVPPLPPPLGEALPPADEVRLSRPVFGDFARETFYGPYATALGLGRFSAKELARFAAYRSARQKLVDEIQLKFDELSAAKPAARTAALNELAARQEEPLHALAVEAESIRNDLSDLIRRNLNGSLYGFNSAGSDDLPFRIGTDGELFNLFTAAYNHAGLSTEQRLLLPEIAYTQQAAFRKKNPEAVAGESAYIYFLPALARIPLPVNLPPELEAKIRAFTSEKESLKGELRTAVLQQTPFFHWHRSRQLATLADQQAPRFKALETLAEEIRVGLADFSLPGQPPQVELPADLTQRVGNFYARKVEVQHELLDRLRSLRTEFPSARFDLARQGGGVAIVQTVTGAKSVPDLAEFNASLARRYEAFANESEVLRRDIQHYTESSPNHAARTVDQLAADFKRAYAARESWNRYRDYYRAVLVPGLSPAQRQLLFRAAAAALDQADQQPQS